MGKEIGRPRRITDEEILQAIREIAVDGRAKSSTDKKLKYMVCYRFGTWEAACHAAGVEPFRSCIKKPTKKEKPVKEVYEPFEDCFAYAGSDCMALNKMLCRYEGKCSFYKMGDTNENTETNCRRKRTV